MAGQAGFFDLDERYAGLSASGDPLERLSRVVDFEIFREDLERALKRSERRRGGRPPMDAVMMFKVLVLQALWGLSDEQLEYQVRDRLSFMRFLGLDLSGWVPDYSTVWRFREALVQAGAMEGLFALRRGTEGARLLRAGRPDHRCLDRRGAEAAPDTDREGGDQARRTARLEAGEGGAQGRGRALDDQARPGEEEAGAGAEGLRAAGLGPVDPGVQADVGAERACRSSRPNGSVACRVSASLWR